MHSPSLVIVYGPDLGKLFELATSAAIVGRSSRCDISLDQESISRNHSRIVNTGTAVTIRDLGSTNGTYVNDVPIQEHVLRDGDLIKIGRTILKYLAAGSIERPYHEELYRRVLANQSPEAPPSARDRSKTVTLSQSDGEPGDEGPGGAS